jgi:protein tyrosine phosphatase
MGNIHNNPSITTETNDYIAKSSHGKTDAKFRKSKVSIFKKIINYLSKKIGISSKKSINKKLQDRTITTQKPLNNSYSYANNSNQQQAKIPNYSEEVFEYWDATKAQQPSQESAINEFYANRLGLTKTSYDTDEPIFEDPKDLIKANNYQDATDKSIYENLRDLQEEYQYNDPDYVNTAEIRELRSGISQNSVTKIESDMQVLKKNLEQRQNNSAQTQILFEETVEDFNNISKASPNFRNSSDKTITADDKYKDIKCPKHSSATKGHIYHANNIELEFGNYVAAQGPYTGSPTTNAKARGAKENIAENFIALLAEKESAISVSLVKDTEFGVNSRSKNDQLPPTEIGETLEIAEIKSDGEVIREKTTIKKLDSIEYKDMKLKTDIFSINGKTHIRVYDLDWEDKTGGNPERLSAISMFVEKLRTLPELADRKDKPVTVNCNAGVGRTGTFIMINNMTRKYLEGSGTHTLENVISDIKTAREQRPLMVQKAEQLETLNTVVDRSTELFKPLAEQFNLSIESK